MVEYLMGTHLDMKGTTYGEIAFNTGMTGYQEIFTDPSYHGQIITMANAHIGNYGTNKEDIESDRIQVSGFIIKEESEVPSNWRSNQSIGNYLKEHKIVGIKNIDTRAVTRHIRDEGAMNGIISSADLDIDTLKDKLSQVQSMEGLDLVQEVTTQSLFEWEQNSKSKKYKVAAIDYGIKYNIIRLLEKSECNVTVFPAKTSATEILKFNPDIIFLSNGPGDPSAVKYGIEYYTGLGKKPIFGICLGHQILSLALGAKTFKLKFGHRGINHPVRNMETGQIEITSQNHGFAVNREEAEKHPPLTAK